MKAPQRSKSLQIYLKPGIREDDVLIDVWEACSRFDRPQDVFRTILRRGLAAMVESGEMPEAVIDACGLDTLIERRKRKTGKARVEPIEPPPQHYQQPYGSQPHYHPYPSPGYGQQTDPAWRHSGETRHRPSDYGYDTPPQEAPRPQAPQYDFRPAETDRRVAEDKVPLDTPRPPISSAPEKQPERPRTEPDGTATDRPPPSKGRKLGQLM